MRILNVGSLNIDHVYGVAHIVRPGETLGTEGYQVFAGGKGANQSAALALAGAGVTHAGRIGPDGLWLRDGLAEIGVDVSAVVLDPEGRTGHAVIQVEAATGENAIFLYPGSNRELTQDQVQAVLAAQQDEFILLLQNEINLTPLALELGADRGATVCLNPAPFHPDVLDWPLARVDLLIVNRTEAAGLSGVPAHAAAEALLDGLHRRWPRVEVLLTLGREGAILRGPGGTWRVEAVDAGPAVDTTGAGDTFIGYFLARRAAGDGPQACLRAAAAAAGIGVTRPGARASIPRLREVESILGE